MRCYREGKSDCHTNPGTRKVSTGANIDTNNDQDTRQPRSTSDATEMHM